MTMFEFMNILQNLRICFANSFVMKIKPSEKVELFIKNKCDFFREKKKCARSLGGTHICFPFERKAGSHVAVDLFFSAAGDRKQLSWPT